MRTHEFKEALAFMALFLCSLALAVGLFASIAIALALMAGSYA